MTHYNTYLKDTIGNNYVGISIYPYTIQPYLTKLESILGDEYEVYVQNQQNRDHGKNHITVINVMDYNRLSKEMGMDKFINSLESVFDYPIDDLKFMGIGTAEKNGNRTYFIVCKSDKLDQIRKKYSLPDQDFHITLGFKWKDVFGVRKNEVLPEIDPFLKLLKQEYYNHNETFEFIRSIQNFDGDKSKDIEPIEIKDTNITFRCGDLDYYIMGLIDNNFRILAHWQDNNKKPILPNTMISKKFNQI
jgi:hypothetical protein